MRPDEFPQPSCVQPHGKLTRSTYKEINRININITIINRYKSYYIRRVLESLFKYDNHAHYLYKYIVLKSSSKKCVVLVNPKTMFSY